MSAPCFCISIIRFMLSSARSISCSALSGCRISSKVSSSFSSIPKRLKRSCCPFISVGMMSFCIFSLSRRALLQKNIWHCSAYKSRRKASASGASTVSFNSLAEVSKSCIPPEEANNTHPTNARWRSSSSASVCCHTSNKSLKRNGSKPFMPLSVTAESNVWLSKVSTIGLQNNFNKAS